MKAFLITTVWWLALESLALSAQGENPRTIIENTLYPVEVDSLFLLGFDGYSSGAVRTYEPFGVIRTAKLPMTVSIPAERFAIVVEE